MDHRGDLLAGHRRQFLGRLLGLSALRPGRADRVRPTYLDHRGADKIGDGLVDAVRGLGIEHGFSTVGPVLTASAGVHYLIPQHRQPLSALLHEADAALYSAKLEGRDRAVVTPR